MSTSTSEPVAYPVPAADAIPVAATATTFFRVLRAVVLKPIVHALFRVRVSGAEMLPPGGYVAIANHSGWADALLLMSLLPSRPRAHLMGDPGAVIALRPLGIPLGQIAWWGLKKMGGWICVDRTLKADPVLRQQAVKCLDLGAALALCPEGRFVRFPGENPDELLPFKTGFAHFATQAGKPIVPIAINGGRRLWWLKRIDVVIGAPISTTGRHWRESGLEAREALAAMHRPDDAPGRFRLFEKQWSRGKPSAATVATLGGSFL